MKYKLIHNSKYIVLILKEDVFVNSNEDITFLGTKEEILDYVNANNLTCAFDLSASF